MGRAPGGVGRGETSDAPDPTEPPRPEQGHVGRRLPDGGVRVEELFPPLPRGALIAHRPQPAGGRTQPATVRTTIAVGVLEERGPPAERALRPFTPGASLNRVALTGRGSAVRWVVLVGGGDSPTPALRGPASPAAQPQPLEHRRPVAPRSPGLGVAPARPTRQQRPGDRYGAGMIDRIAWATLAVSDQDTMRRFFVDVLDFTVVTDAEMWDGARWLEVAPGGVGAQTSLVLSKASDFDREPDTQYPIGLHAEDLQGVADAAKKHGVETTEPVTEAWGSFVRLTDPEGRQLLVRS